MFRGFIIAFFTIIFTSNVSAIEKKVLTHLAIIPLTEGSGIYSSVKAIDQGNTGSKIAGITNVSLLAINAGLGSYMYFAKPSNYGTLSTLHHIIGFTAIGTALWLTIASSTDNKIDSHVKYISSGYTALTTVPLIVFNF